MTSAKHLTTIGLIAAFTALSACDTTMMGNVDADRLDPAVDTDGDGMVSDDEFIMANMARFDTNGDGVLDATERGVAEQMVESNS